MQGNKNQDSHVTECNQAKTHDIYDKTHDKYDKTHSIYDEPRIDEHALAVCKICWYITLDVYKKYCVYQFKIFQPLIKLDVKRQEFHTKAIYNM